MTITFEGVVTNAGRLQGTITWTDAPSNARRIDIGVEYYNDSARSSFYDFIPWIIATTISGGSSGTQDVDVDVSDLDGNNPFETSKYWSLDMGYSSSSGSDAGSNHISGAGSRLPTPLPQVGTRFPIPPPVTFELVLTTPTTNQQITHNDTVRPAVSITEPGSTTVVTGVTVSYVVNDGTTDTTHTTAPNLGALAVGSYTIKAIGVKDSETQESDPVAFTVVRNMPPVVTIHYPANRAVILRGVFEERVRASALDDLQGTRPITAYEFHGQDNIVSTSAPDLSTFAAGEYTMTVKASDSQGNEGTAAITITVENPPAGFQLYERTEKIHAAGTTSINHLIGFAHIPANIQYRLEARLLKHGTTTPIEVNGIAQPAEATRTGHLTLATPGLSNGAWTIAIILRDLTNNQSLGAVGYEVDIGDPPDITITSPTTNQQIPRGSTVNLAATATDTTDGDISTDITWHDITDPENINPVLANINLGTLRAGTYTYQARVQNSANLTRHVNVTFVILPDTVNPVITVITPVNNEQLFEDAPNFAGSATATDAVDGDITSRIEWFKITNRGSDNQVDTKLTPLQIAALNTLGVGVHDLEIRVKDLSDNQAVVRRDITVYDPEFTLRVGNIGSDQVLATAFIRFTGMPSNPLRRFQYLLTITSGDYTTSTQDSLSFVSDNNKLFAVTRNNDRVLNVRLDVKERTDTETPGIRESAITFFNRIAGRIIASGITTTFTQGTPDTTNPTITITSPTPNQMIPSDSAQIDVTATASDNIDGDITSSITWQDITDPTNPTTATLTNIQDLTAGTYTYRASVSDSAGNVGTRDITFTIIPPDTTPPVVTITSPTNNARIRRRSVIRLAATATDNLDGNIASIAWSFRRGSEQYQDISDPTNFRLTSQGNYTIRASATDAAGNTGHATISITITREPDTTAPTISITSPLNGTDIVFGDIMLIATATDNIDGDISSSIVWQDITDPENIFNYDPAAPVRFPLGTNTIRATVRDAAGNTATATSTFTIIPSRVGPVLNITSPMGVGGSVFSTNSGLPVTFMGTAIDALDGDLGSSIVWSDLTSGQVIGTGTSVTYTPVGLGIHTIEASVTDSHDNTTTARTTINIVFIFENQAIRIEFIRRISGASTSQFPDSVIIRNMRISDINAIELLGIDITRESVDPFVWHDVITLSNFLIALEIFIRKSTGSDDTESNEAINFIEEFYPEMVRAMLNALRFTDTTIVDIIPLRGDGTFQHDNL